MMVSYAFKTSAATVLMISFFLFLGCAKVSDVQPLRSTGAPFSATVQRPNIIMILGDDIGFEIPTCNGGQSYETPNIDAIANEGMRFTNCYTAPLCSPSRFMLMTGKYNYRNYTAWGIMDPHEKTVATLLKGAGYATYVGAKWQFDGGDASIHSLGFDDYCIWNPYQDSLMGSHYKDPVIYQAGGYVPTPLTKNKYGDDIFTDSILHFIDLNRSKNFFVYFPITLCHEPFSPTPDDPAFKTWDPKDHLTDTSYFRSMVKYMDKKIGQVMDSLKAWNLYDNTIIMFAGDNGTPSDISSLYNGKVIQGGKASTNVLGTKVPLVVTWPGHVVQGVDKNLVDFTDFLPTFADAAGVNIPGDYGPVDGVSFFDQLVGVKSKPRSWVYCYYHPLSQEGGNTLLAVWAQDGNYKLYDSLDLFFNEIRDPQEKRPLTRLTAAQQRIKDSLRSVIDYEAAQF